LALAVAVASGCDGGEADGRQRVYGTVTLDDVPLAKGVIAFDPASDGGGSVSTGGVIVDGAYSIDAESGPTPGKYRVSIRSGGSETAATKAAPGMPPPLKAVKGDPIPKKYNVESTLTAEVKPTGSTEANFELSSR
jgi:hypothetical protein